MKKLNSTELIEKANEAYENLEHDMLYDKADFILGYIKCYTDIAHEADDIHNVSECDYCENDLYVENGGSKMCRGCYNALD